SGGEQVAVPEVMKVCDAEVMKTCEVVSWEVRAMTERMSARRSAGRAKAVHAAHAVHAAAHAVHAAAHAVHAAKTAHRLGGQYRWRDKHPHHDSTSNRVFAEHDNPPDCHPPHRNESAMQDVQMTKNLFSDRRFNF